MTYWPDYSVLSQRDKFATINSFFSIGDVEREVVVPSIEGGQPVRLNSISRKGPTAIRIVLESFQQQIPQGFTVVGNKNISVTMREGAPPLLFNIRGTVVYGDNRNFYTRNWSNPWLATKLRQPASLKVAGALRLFGSKLEDSLGFDAAFCRVAEATEASRRSQICLPEGVEKLIRQTLGWEWHLHHYLTNSRYRQRGGLHLSLEYWERKVVNWELRRELRDEYERSAYRRWALRENEAALYSFISYEQVAFGVVLNGAPASYSSRAVGLVATVKRESPIPGTLLFRPYLYAPEGPLPDDEW